LLVAVGACVCARAGIFNIGQEGQVLMGALGGAYAGLRLAISGPLLLVCVLVFGAVAGGIWAGLSSLMFRYRGVNVVVSTLLMTFLAQQIVGYAVNTQWSLQETPQGTSGIAGSESNPLPVNGRLRTFGQYPDLSVNFGLILALVAALVIAFLLARTRWGFRLKLIGLNPVTARHAGVRVAAIGGLSLAISGAFAGLAGAVLLASPISTNRLQPGISVNVGWDGLLVALIARNRPGLCVPAALLFAVLRAGGDFLAATGVPSYLADVVKALLVLALVAPGVVGATLRRRRQSVPGSAAPSTPARTVEEVAV
jgi:simple sugar transport system permease protein